MLQQLSNTEDDTLLMNVVIEQMTCDSDPDMGGAVQLMYIIKDLLDPENMLGAVNKQEKTDFLNYFYKHCMHVLIGKFDDNFLYLYLFNVNEKYYALQPSAFPDFFRYQFYTLQLFFVRFMNKL